MTLPNSGPTDPSRSPHSEPPRARASDADREAVVRTLHDAVARGLLSLEEGDERMTAAYAARFVDDLPRLTADLPPAPLPAPVAPGWRALAVLAFLQLRAALSGIPWRAVRGSRRRLALAAVVVLAVLSLGGVAAAELVDHGGDAGHQVEHVDQD